ncbi:MAG: bifunctional 4-hydroxy-2-oxoglutarate aldolase/2-dehydro-3-deoxy-phosphogluconate aldolase, partial [Planctomycetota bacterium]
MSRRIELTERLCTKGIIAVVRAADSEQLEDVARALLTGGVDCIEITMTTPNALEVIAACRRSLPDEALIGVGSVTDAPTARQAVAAGAQFLLSPIFKREIVDVAHQADLPAVPGCFTPTEIRCATDAGADMVKV